MYCACALLRVQSTHVSNSTSAEPQEARTSDLAPWSHSCMLSVVLCLASQNNKASLMVVPVVRSDEMAPAFRQTPDRSFGLMLRSMTPIRPCFALHAAMTVQASSRTLRLRAGAQPDHDLLRRQPDPTPSSPYEYQTRHGWLTLTPAFPALRLTATGRPAFSRDCGGMLEAARCLSCSSPRDVIGFAGRVGCHRNSV